MHFKQTQMELRHFQEDGVSHKCE